MSNEPIDEGEVTTCTPTAPGTGSSPVAGARHGGTGVCNLCDETDGHTGQCPVVS